MRPMGSAGPELAAGTGALRGARASIIASVCQASSVQRVAEQILLVAVDRQTSYAAHKIYGGHLQVIVLVTTNCYISSDSQCSYKHVKTYYRLQQVVFHPVCSLYSLRFFFFSLSQ